MYSKRLPKTSTKNVNCSSFILRDKLKNFAPGQMNDTQQHVHWKYVILFVLISYLISAPANLGWLSDTLENFSLPFGLDQFKILLQGIGPFVAGLVLRKLHPNVIDSTPRGKYKSTGWMMLGISVILLTVIGNQNDKGLNPYYWGTLTAIVLSIHAYFEETGWRGYLEHALQPLSEPIRVLLIAVVWYFWHLSFLSGNSIKSEALFFLILLVGTWLLGRLLEQTKSILIVAAFHSVFNLMQWWDLSFTPKIIWLSVLVLVWILLMTFQKKKHKIEG